ncbi:MAG TPA: YqjK-like family protein [Sulfuriferula sp.]|nr:YqjK-like family protein [Sulfuriferula sp.]
MKHNLHQIAQRRSHLQALAALQRVQLGQSIESLRTPLLLLDRGVDAIRFVRRNPLLLAGAGALFVALRRYGAGKWMRRGWVVWQLVRRLRRK